MIKYSLHWHMKFQEHLTFIFQNLYLWDGYNFCHPSLWRNEVTLVLGLEALNFIRYTYSMLFSMCWNICYQPIIILVKAFPTRLPYQDIENRTYLNVLYEYLSANLPYNNLGKKIRHLRMRREPTFAERISFRQTSLVSSNESRFVKWVSFRQMSLVVSNESRFVKRASLWLVSILSNKRVSLKIVYRVTYKSWRFKIEWFPRNREWSPRFNELEMQSILFELDSTISCSIKKTSSTNSICSYRPQLFLSSSVCHVFYRARFASHSIGFISSSIWYRARFNLHSANER